MHEIQKNDESYSAHQVNPGSVSDPYKEKDVALYLRKAPIRLTLEVTGYLFVLGTVHRVAGKGASTSGREKS